LGSSSSVPSPSRTSSSRAPPVSILLLNQPYGIGDEVRIGDQTGIVQEVDLFVTKIEDDSEEYIVPNRKIFENGIIRMRD